MVASRARLVSTVIAAEVGVLDQIGDGGSCSVEAAAMS
jgi:hypothetical protein